MIGAFAPASQASCSNGLRDGKTGMNLSVFGVCGPGLGSILTRRGAGGMVIATSTMSAYRCRFLGGCKLETTVPPTWLYPSVIITV